MKSRQNPFIILRHAELPVADVLVEAIVRLRELQKLEMARNLSQTERRALKSAISELKEIIRKNVC